MTNGVEYTVFAIYLRLPIEFMVQVDSLPSEPIPVCYDDVEVVDNRLSNYWLFGDAISETNELMGRPAILAFSEWVNDIGFYQDIVDGKNNAGKIWREYRKKMELEFAPSRLVNSAVDLGDGWLQCMSCSDSWRPDTVGEVVCCPSCSTLMRRADLNN